MIITFIIKVGLEISFFFFMLFWELKLSILSKSKIPSLFLLLFLDPFIDSRNCFDYFL